MTRPISMFVLALGLFALGGTTPGAVRGDNDDDDDGGDSGDSRIARGFAIAPVPLDLRGKNRSLVGLGSYFVNAAGGLGSP